MIYHFHDHAWRGGEHRAAVLVLFLALIHGLVYLLLVPPWQHYDEPSHFEFAWLIANRNRLPERDEFDQILRREVAASMLEHNFFRGMQTRPNLISQGEPVWIGSSQINERPLYYVLVALPLKIFKATDVTFQLYFARLVSLGLLIITVLAAYGVMAEITNPGNPLRWMVPLTIVLIPGFTDLMTAVNDDVGATAFFSLFLWAGVRIIRRGFSWFRLLALALATAVCFWTKNTVTFAAILAFVPFIFSIFKTKQRIFAWLILLGGILIAVIAAFSWGDAAKWYRLNFPDVPARAQRGETPHGRYAFYLPIPKGGPRPSLMQVFPAADIQRLRGKTVTVGAWIWASRPLKVRTPILINGSETIYEEVQVDEKPTYFYFSTNIRENAEQLQLMLSPLRSRENEEVFVYYDGLVLVEGEFDEQMVDVYDSKNSLWFNELSSSNFIRNASAESSWPYMHVWADNWIKGFFPGRFSLVLGAFLDWSPPFWYYSAALRQLGTTFWGRFGWGHVPLVGFHPYTILGIASLVGLIGTVIMVLKKRGILPGNILFFFLVTVTAIWGAAVMRGIGSILGGPVFIPSARYANPAIIPTVLFLVLGWLGLICFMNRKFLLPLKGLFLSYILLFIGLDLLSIFSIFQFYYR